MTRDLQPTPGLWRPESSALVRSRHSLDAGSRRKLENLLEERGVAWGYVGASGRRMLVREDVAWLRRKVRNLGWDSTLVVEAVD